MTYQVTARKWRPMKFEEIVGQEHVATTLRNAIAAGRLTHAYIFSGPRGVGKTSTARILAKAVNCLHPDGSNPDNECDLCKEITECRSVNVFEIDGASNRGVDEIRNLREAVRYGPAKGKFKVYIIDEVHMLTKEAFNALLKTLEEPPSYIVFIFATTEIHKVPPTILSRCQRFDFRRITVDEITKRLRFIADKEHISISDDALFIIARRGDGSMRDAQSILDQVVSYSGDKVGADQIAAMLNIVDEEIYFRVTDLIKAKDVKGSLLLVDEILKRGYDIREFLNGLTEHLRNLLIALSTETASLIETSEIYRSRYAELAKSFSESSLLRLIKIATDTDTAIRWNQQPRIRLEIGLVQMIRLGSSDETGKFALEPADLKNRRGADDVVPGKTAGTPLKGSVRASLPALRADQVIPAIPARAASVTGRAEIPPVLRITREEANTKWSVIVEETRKERIALGTMLSETLLVGVDEGRLCIGCPDDFHRDTLTLKRNHQFLQNLAERIYGAKVQLEAIISPGSASGKKQPAVPAESDEQIARSKTGSHPVVQALIREFGAKPVHG